MTTYSITELAQLTDMPESTVRYNIKTFAEYFPAVGSGRNRRYKPECLDTLRLIAEQRSRNISAEHIKALLNQSPQVTQELTETVARNTATTQQTSEHAMVVIAETLQAVMIQHDERIRNLETEYQQRIESLENRIAELLEHRGEGQPQLQEKRRSWWQRFRG